MVLTAEYITSLGIALREAPKSVPAVAIHGVDASLPEVYSEAAVARATGAAPPPSSAHESA